MKNNEKKSVSFGAKILAALLAVLMISGTVFAVISYILS